ncbi:MAG TPA: hypothetical protein VFV17_06800 [Usitatibacteraceae bacterium]|nr:hypothetical protein [Usitatibacteraceae bacterium]
MKRIAIFATAACLLAGCAALPTPAPSAPPQRDWFIFLETGKPTPPDKEAVAAMQRGHIANFQRLFGEKKLFAAGPLRDPAKVKRGIVVVKAATREELAGYFVPDDYVREGYMTLNAEPARVEKALNHEGIDPNGIEEVRIALLMRPTTAQAERDQAAGEAVLRELVARGVFGAWYRPESGAVAEILFANSRDDATLMAALAAHPGVQSKSMRAAVWGQWLSRGVVR